MGRRKKTLGQAWPSLAQCGLRLIFIETVLFYGYDFISLRRRIVPIVKWYIASVKRLLFLFKKNRY